MWTMTNQLAKHPRVLGFLLNNKLIVKAYMRRADTQKACSNPNVMADYFANTRSDFQIAHQMARANPETARVAFGSELFKQVANCPGMQQAVSSPSLAVKIVSNPVLVGALSDPVVLNGLSSNDSSAQLFGELQKAQTGP